MSSSSETKQSEEIILESSQVSPLPEPITESVDSSISEEPTVKKPRKPFVFTEKRRQAFEKCRQLRAEKVAERQKALSEGQVSDLPRWRVHRELKRLRQQLELTNTNTVDFTPQSQTQEVTTAKEMEISAQLPNQAPQIMETNAPSVDTNLKMEMKPIEIPMMQSSQLTNESIPMKMETEDRKRKHVEFADTIYEEESEMEDESDNISFHGTGAGNHAPFIDEKYEDTVDPSNLDDETLYRLLAEAKAREERKSLFEHRRTEHKIQRPSNASMFLDSVQSFNNHPSQLFNANSLYVRNNVSSLPVNRQSNYTWL
jgi:hypothetical protein